jgi:hypothetical protein
MTADAASETVDAAPVEDAPEPALSATVVKYRNSPDRCTVTPADVSEDQQFTAWLSIDADAVVSLAEVR